MKKSEVKIGHSYEAKVSDRIVTVRIDSTNSHGGWNATNTATGKRIRIKGPQRLRRPVGRASAAPEATRTVEPATATRTRKAAGEPKPKKVSLLAAAIQVLKAATAPMHVKEIFEQIVNGGLWSSPAGKTPAATLSAAMLRELGKGPEARVRKTDRGLFAYQGA